VRVVERFPEFQITQQGVAFNADAILLRDTLERLEVSLANQSGPVAIVMQILAECRDVFRQFGAKGECAMLRGILPGDAGRR
jgi:hypothetical protein